MNKKIQIIIACIISMASVMVVAKDRVFINEYSVLAEDKTVVSMIQRWVKHAYPDREIIVDMVSDVKIENKNIINENWRPIKVTNLNDAIKRLTTFMDKEDITGNGFENPFICVFDTAVYITSSNNGCIGISLKNKEQTQ